MKPLIITERDMPHGEIHCSHATRRALFRAGIGDLDFVIVPLVETITTPPAPELRDRPLPG